VCAVPVSPGTDQGTALPSTRLIQRYSSRLVEDYFDCRAMRKSAAVLAKRGR
jgi:hypothetical protein